MASSFTSNMTAMVSLLLILAFINLYGALGETTCENLNRNTCTFAVSSSGMRCTLEKSLRTYACRTSGIKADGIRDWIETDECIEACGLDRSSLGISSDSLLEPGFTSTLCSSPCFTRCPNIVDLYFNLAAAEGVYLPKLCQAQQTSARRAMAEIRSSGAVFAEGPSSSAVFAAGPESAAASAPTES